MCATDLRLWKNQSRSTSTSFTCIDRISTNAEDTESADAPVDANMTWREPQQTSSSGLEMGEEWQTRLQSRVRWPRTHPDELWSGAEHFEAALMTSCGTLPGLLSARRDRERETPETGCDGQTEYFGFFRPSRCEAGEMSYLRSGSSLHSQFLWPQNCTCLLTADPGGGKKQQPNTWAMKKTKGLIYEQWTVCLTDLLKAGN